MVFNIQEAQFTYGLYDRIFYLPTAQEAVNVRDAGLEDRLPGWWDFERTEIIAPWFLVHTHVHRVEHVHPFTAQQLWDNPEVQSVEDVEKSLTTIYPTAQSHLLSCMALNYLAVREVPRILKKKLTLFGPSVYLIAAARTAAKAGVDRLTIHQEEDQRHRMMRKNSVQQERLRRFYSLTEESRHRELGLIEKLPSWEEELQSYRDRHEDKGLFKLELSNQDGFLQPAPLRKMREIYLPVTLK